MGWSSGVRVRGVIIRVSKWPPVTKQGWAQKHTYVHIMRLPTPNSRRVAERSSCWPRSEQDHDHRACTVFLPACCRPDSTCPTPRPSSRCGITPGRPRGSPRSSAERGRDGTRWSVAPGHAPARGASGVGKGPNGSGRARHVVVVDPRSPHPASELRRTQRPHAERVPTWKRVSTTTASSGCSYTMRYRGRASSRSVGSPRSGTMHPESGNARS